MAKEVEKKEVELNPHASSPIKLDWAKKAIEVQDNGSPTVEKKK